MSFVLFVQDMFSAGSDTSASVLIWCMTELIRSPTAMARVQAEVREAFKSKSTITEEDISRADADLVYLKLVIKETLRMHTQLPLLIPRRCRRTCRIMGYVRHPGGHDGDGQCVGDL